MQQYSQNQVTNQTNQIIKNVLQKQQQQAAEVHPDYGQLWQALGELMLAGGKRLRPYLTYVTYTMFTDECQPEILNIGAAQEFLHFSLLIHDDIIDRDKIRYGKKNIMGEYESIYAAAAQDSSHFASGAALIAGNLALSQAYTLINQSSFPADKKHEATNYLSQSIFHVAGGELLDMEAAFRQPGADYFTIARHKTASYSFVGPLLTGAAIASAPIAAHKQLTEFGINLGITYQLADDLLGLYGNEELIGKPVTSDLREGKKTHLFDLIQQLSNPEDRKYFNSVWGNSDVTMDDIQRVRQIGKETKATNRVEELMHQYAQKATRALDGLLLAGEKDRMAPLHELALKAVRRSY